MSASQLETVSAACQVILKYLVSTLRTVISDSNPNSVQIERYLNAIRVLCQGIGILPSAEVKALIDIMKGENPPANTASPGTYHIRLSFVRLSS